MTLHRRNLLYSLLVLCIGAWVVLLSFENHYTAIADPPRYSLIEGGLYQGGHVAEPPPGTTAVLNLCEMTDPYTCEIHCHEAIPDAAPAPSLDWLRQRVAFVDEQRQAGKVVYVHCAAGVSRAGMVVTAYEMYKNHWTRDEALAFVRRQRPATNPNPAFMQLLVEWEEELKNTGPSRTRQKVGQ
jgi:hypothetical protein